MSEIGMEVLYIIYQEFIRLTLFVHFNSTYRIQINKGHYTK